MKRRLTALLLIAGTALPACSSSSSTTLAAAPITGLKTCAADEAQQLTFSGALTGYLACSLAPPYCHRTHGPRSPGVTMTLLGRSGTKPVSLRIAFGNDHLGTFTATPIGDEPNLDQQGVTLMGPGDWSTPNNGGTLTVLVEERPSLEQEGRVAGSVDVTLVSGATSARLKGSWACIKTLAGGDGWSTA